MKKLTATLIVSAAAAMAIAAPAAANVNTNSASYWSNQLGVECTKLPTAAMMWWTADNDYKYVLVKGGAVDYGYGAGVKLWSDVVTGDQVGAPINGGGQQAAISWIITCGPGGGYGY